MFGFKTRRRNRIRSQPFPESCLTILQRNVPYYGRLTPEDRQRLLGDIQVFVAEKNFEGCGGLEMTEEIKVTLAAYACILLLHLKHNYYPRLQSILVYHDTYPVPGVRRAVGNILVEGVEMRAGELEWLSFLGTMFSTALPIRAGDETLSSMSSRISSTRKTGLRTAHRFCRALRCTQPGLVFSVGSTRCYQKLSTPIVRLCSTSMGRRILLSSTPSSRSLSLNSRSSSESDIQHCTKS